MQPSATGIQPSVELQKQLTQLHISMWLKEDLLHLDWWILIGLVCASVGAWFLLIKREGLKEACLYAAIAALLAFGVNEYGEELILWDYPTDIIPYFPPLTSINLILLPLALSVLYQRFRTWKSFLWAALIASAAVSLVVEPLLALANMYEPINWNYFFSLPVFYLLAVVARWMTEKVTAISRRNLRTGGAP